MDEWVIWLIAAVALAVGEILNLSFFLFPFAIGAVAAAAVSLAGAGTPVAFAAFAVLTAVSFAVVRPIAQRHLRHARRSCARGRRRSSGAPAVVLEPIDNDAGARARCGSTGEIVDRAGLRRGPDLRGRRARARHGDQGRHGARERLRGEQRMAALIVAAVLILFALFVAARTVRIIPQARAGVVERLGRYSRTLTPGLTHRHPVRGPREAR